MENVKKELSALGYSKTQIAIMIAAIQGIVFAPSLYAAANDAAATIRDTTAELGSVSATLKQIGAVVGMTPPKKVTPKKKEPAPVIPGTDISPAQLDIAGKAAGEAKSIPKKEKKPSPPLVPPASGGEAPEPHTEDKGRKLTIEL